ncbi:MAG: hypothetical protein ACLR7G_15805 [[Clostridium] symbiosum]
MKKIQYSIWKKETNSAGGKAKNDAYEILRELDFEASYNPSDKSFVRIIQQILSMSKLIGNKVLIIQYPALKEFMLKLLLRFINHNDISVALIHDLPSIQGMYDGDKKLEIAYLRHFTHLIVHNHHMAEYIKALGYQGRMVSIELFDYLHDVNREVAVSPFSNSISFAGNLKKSSFLMDIGKVRECKFNLYGIKGDLDFNNIKNVSYLGCLPSDEIVYNLDGDYGLIWDGDSIETCSGIYGKYLKYNNPHKLSLYIAAGKPVITWRYAAVADFVISEQIGIVVDSLIELNDMDLLENYEKMRENVLKIKARIAKGEYLKTAVNKVLDDEGE